MSGVCPLLFAGLLASGPGLLLQTSRQPVALAPSGLRLMVLERDYEDEGAWKAIGDVGANAVATLRPPNAVDDERATAAGLTYLAFLTTDEIQSFARNTARVAEAREQRSLAGFYYWDAKVTEGFTGVEDQRQAYSTLKLLFPDKLVLYPTRLDLIVSIPDFLERYFRPEFTDLVTPYFYPVGTTVIGEARESDGWRLEELLAALSVHLPLGKNLLPLLQGFEQTGYPVSSGFLARQLALYRKFWPDLTNAAVFAWKFSTAEPGPLVEIAGRPDLEEGACRLFTALSRRPGCRARREVSWR